MIWYVADTSAGDSYFVLAGPGVSKEAFFKLVLEAVIDDDPECTPQDLTLHRLRDEEAIAWIDGKLPVTGESWTTFHNRTLIGEIRYQYPGEWKLLKETS